MWCIGKSDTIVSSGVKSTVSAAEETTEKTTEETTESETESETISETETSGSSNEDNKAMNNSLTYKSKTRMWLENLFDKVWALVRKDTELPIEIYRKYWWLQCTPPW